MKTLVCIVIVLVLCSGCSSMLAPSQLTIGASYDRQLGVGEEVSLTWDLRK